MINKLLKKEMEEQDLTFTSLSRKCDLNPVTVKNALETNNGKISIYEIIAKALDKKIKYTVE